ncbi:MAG: hypothetical protein EBT54_00715 [Betaproteobacteria bacterium]|nr:hypothetical protein [Betaproteobacteria bacterium]
MALRVVAQLFEDAVDRRTLLSHRKIAVVAQAGVKTDESEAVAHPAGRPRRRVNEIRRRGSGVMLASKCHRRR